MRCAVISAKNLLRTYYPTLESRPTLFKIACAAARFMIREQDFQAFAKLHPEARGLCFIDLVMEHFDFDMVLSEEDRIRIPSRGRVVIVANHPIGSLDGLGLLRLVSHIRRDVKIVANERLSAIKPIEDLIFTVDNMTGNTSRQQITAIHQHLNKDGAVIIFPAGEVSRMGPRGVRDGKWRKGFLRMARATHAPILPVFVQARNSIPFYLTSMLFKRLSAALLVREMFGQARKKVPVRVGDLVDYGSISAPGTNDKALAKLFRSHVERIGKGKKGLFKTMRAIGRPESEIDVFRDLGHQKILGQTPDGKIIYLARDIAGTSLLREIGRLREETFRAVGEGTGKAYDCDEYDLDYYHLVLWDEKDAEIAGAYRFCDTRKLIAEKGPEALYTHRLFELGDEMTPYLAEGLELGRSFVQPKYWGKRSLEYLWIGMGAFLREHPNYRYLFGAVSISNQLPQGAQDLMVYFYRLYFQQRDGVVASRYPYHFKQRSIEDLAQTFDGGDYATDFKRLKALLANMGVAVPTLYKQYTELTEPGGSQFFDFGSDPGFSDAVDGMVMVDLTLLKPKKRARYMGDNWSMAEKDHMRITPAS
ncbi:GNAT family N-acetyltransferase [Paremcibacter congregatus]|uniref:L-ornithine N(alpha)-acyltransferase n=1 Tax=Paremcibacter congregatus TaxID=2043170 RepID=A0A2G4YT96_9PROT|nr:GNAT family N-acetyltransferase [Paremcibacter congregatus]QDE26522.1 lysophospholipid acyltransferase family protein [Paremcibacter congregatus]